MPVSVNVGVSFEPVDIDITLGNLRVTLPAYPASVWLPILTDPGLDGLEIFPGMLVGEDQDQVDELIFAGQLGVDEIRDITYEIIGEVSGHAWWWSLNLLSILKGPNATQLLGEMTSLDASQVSLACWVNTLYARLVKHMDHKDRMKLDGELEMPPPSVQVEISETDQKATEQTFFNMMRNG